jgi:hypothetical protein
VIEAERDFRAGSLVLKKSVFVVALDPSQYSFPERATVAPGNNRDKEHLMLDVVKLALGLGFFFVAVGYAHACDASEENENDFRLFTRRCRRCRLAVLLDLRPATA